MTIRFLFTLCIVQWTSNEQNDNIIKYTARPSDEARRKGQDIVIRDEDHDHEKKGKEEKEHH